MMIQPNTADDLFQCVKNGGKWSDALKRVVFLHLTRLGRTSGSCHIIRDGKRLFSVKLHLCWGESKSVVTANIRKYVTIYFNPSEISQNDLVINWDDIKDTLIDDE